MQARKRLVLFRGENDAAPRSKSYAAMAQDIETFPVRTQKKLLRAFLAIGIINVLGNKGVSGHDDEH